MKYNGLILVLDLKHVDEAMYRIRKCQKKYSNMIDQHSIVLDEAFNQLVLCNYNAHPEIANNEPMQYVYDASPNN